MEWLKAFFAVSVLLGVGGAVAPASPKIRKATAFAFSVLFLSLLLSGLKTEGLLELLRFEVGEKTEKVEDGAWENAYREGVEEGILLDLCGRFALKKEETSVSLSLCYQEEEVFISSLKVFLSGTSAFGDIPALVRYAESVYGADCEVVIGNG